MLTIKPNCNSPVLDEDAAFPKASNTVLSINPVVHTLFLVTDCACAAHHTTAPKPMLVSDANWLR